MAKRVHTDKSRLGDLGDLEKAAADITGQQGKSFTLADTKPTKEREPGLTARGRQKFTTMLKPELRDKLQAIATNKMISIADVLETIIEEYLGLKK